MEALLCSTDGTDKQSCGRAAALNDYAHVF